MFKFIIYFSIFIINSINGYVINNCEISSYCGNEAYGCSIYSNCNFKLFEYYKVNTTEEDKHNLIHCQCYMGYSSYDIEVQKKDNNVLCCYKQKGTLTAFFLELFLGIGIGHFYLGNYVFGGIKLAVQIFFCSVIACVTYFACTREHSFETNYNEINNNENVNKNNLNENKNNENKNENKEMIDENNENFDNDIGTNDNKNNESKNQSFELEENKENELMFKNFISCPKSMLAIYFAVSSFIIFHVVDVFLIAYGVFKDENGEELYMWK